MGSPNLVGVVQSASRLKREFSEYEWPAAALFAAEDYQAAKLTLTVKAEKAFGSAWATVIRAERCITFLAARRADTAVVIVNHRDTYSGPAQRRRRLVALDWLEDN